MKKTTTIAIVLIIGITAIGYPAIACRNISMRSVEAGEWTGHIRIEGNTSTIWNGEVTVEDSTITAMNASSGEMETYYIPYPSVLGALDEASQTGGFSYFVIYFPSWDAFFVQSIEVDTDWWNYWVDYEQPIIGVGKYELTENDDEILWGFLVTYPPNYEAHALRISIDKYEVKKNEEFIVSVYNETMSPVEGATVYVDSVTFTTNETGQVTIQLSQKGTYEIYAEKEEHVRSEKLSLMVKKSHVKINESLQNMIQVTMGKTMFRFLQLERVLKQICILGI